MFWKKKGEKQNNEEGGNPKKKKIWEKVLMGAVIGGAVGSVVGASIKKGQKKEGWESPAVDVSSRKKGLKGRKKGVIRRLLSSFVKSKEPNKLRKIPNEEVVHENKH